MRGRLVALEGGSASGKSTLVRVAARRYGWRPLSEAVDRLDPSPSIEFDSSLELLRLEETLLAEETHRYREARRLCEQGETVLADTGFLGPVTYTLGLVTIGGSPASVGRTLVRSARSLVRRGALGVPDLTVYLHTTARERAARARRDAERHPRRLRARHEAVGRFERMLFEEVLPQVLPGRFFQLRARSAPVSLARHLEAVLSRAGTARRPSRAEALAVVSTLEGWTGKARRSVVGPNR